MLQKYHHIVFSLIFLRSIASWVCFFMYGLPLAHLSKYHVHLSWRHKQCASFQWNNVFLCMFWCLCHHNYSATEDICCCEVSYSERKEARLPRIPLVGVLTAAVGAVAVFGHVGERMNVGIQLGHPVTRHQERRQVEQIHKHFVAVTKGKENNWFHIDLKFSHNIFRRLLQIELSKRQKLAAKT